MKKIPLNHEQIKFLDNMIYSKDKLETTQLTINDKLNWMHFYQINAKLLHSSFMDIYKSNNQYERISPSFPLWLAFDTIKKGELMLRYHSKYFELNISNWINNTIEIF